MSATFVSRPPAISWRGEFRSCIALSVPLMLTNAIEMAMNLTNTAMIGRIAPEALAAATLALALYYVPLMFGIGLTAAVSALISREIGRTGVPGEAVRRVAQGGFCNAAVIVGPIWLVLWNAEPIFRALGQAPALARDAATYMHAIQWTLLPAMIYLTLRSTLASLERPRWAVMTGLVAVVLNAALNVLLIRGGWGVTAFGLAGSGIATFASNLFMAVALCLAVILDPKLRALHVFAGLRHPPLEACGALWRLGLPIGISLVLETGMFSAAADLIGHFDEPALAAHAIALQVASFTFMVPLGIAQAATVRVGRAAGAGDHPAVGRAGWTALALALGVMAISASAMIGLPTLLIGLFLGPNEPGAAIVIPTATVLLALAGVFQLADGAQVTLAGMLRGLGDTRVPMLISVAGYWGVGVPIAAVLATRLGASGVWTGLVAGLFAVAGLLFVRWRSWRTRGRPPKQA